MFLLCLKGIIFAFPFFSLSLLISFPNRQFSCYVGGQILCGMSNFERLWYDKAEYDECGPCIVHRKSL